MENIEQMIKATRTRLNQDIFRAYVIITSPPDEELIYHLLRDRLYSNKNGYWIFWALRSKVPSYLDEDDIAFWKEFQMLYFKHQWKEIERQNRHLYQLFAAMAKKMKGETK